MAGREDLAPKGLDILTRDVSLDEIQSLFDITTGHDHDGANSALVSWNNIADKPSGSYYSLTAPTNEFTSSDDDAGNLTLSWKTQSAGLVLASPTASSGTPSFRSLIISDIPTITLSKLDNIASGSILGRKTALTGEVEALTITDIKTMLDVINYGVCTTDEATVNKTVDITNFALSLGTKVTVKFDNANSVSNPTLNVSSTGAKAIYNGSSAIDPAMLEAGKIYDFVYDGTNYVLISGSGSGGSGVSEPTAKTIIATAGQTEFTYTDLDGWTDDLLGLLVFRNGVYMTPSLDYFIDNNNKKITFVTPCVVNEVITVIFNNSGAVDIPFTLPIASATVNGIVTTGNQTFAGVKTFNEGIVGNLTGTATNATNATITNNTASTLYLVGALNTTTGNKSLQTNPSAYVTSAGYLYATRVYNAVYNDYAECFDNKILIYEDVKNRIIELDENNNTILASEDSNLVIGIVSDNYGYLLGGTEEDIQNDSKIPVGLSGVLFVDSKEKVNIKNRGKFISSANEGYAKVLDSYLHGSVVGKIIGIDEINNRYKVIISLM